MYALARAARYWHVPPWQLLEQPGLWLRMAVTLEAIEADAEQQHAEIEQAQARARAAAAPP